MVTLPAIKLTLNSRMPETGETRCNGHFIRAIHSTRKVSCSAVASAFNDGLLRLV
jgi:hypothetical protein